MGFFATLGIIIEYTCYVSIIAFVLQSFGIIKFNNTNLPGNENDSGWNKAAGMVTDFIEDLKTGAKKKPAAKETAKEPTKTE